MSTLLKDKKYTKDQQAFLAERAQQELVSWCDQVMRSGDMKSNIKLDPKCPYVRHAADRKSPWITEKGPGEYFIVGPGWRAARSFLKR